MCNRWSERLLRTNEELVTGAARADDEALSNVVMIK